MDKISKNMGGQKPDDLLKELEKLKKKAKEADDLKKKLGKTPEELAKENDKMKSQIKEKDAIIDKLKNENDRLKGDLADALKKLDDY